jgi:hypothetical protein
VAVEKNTTIIFGRASGENLPPKMWRAGNTCIE